MRSVWVFGHLLGFTLWLGGAAAAMVVGIGMKRETREAMGPAARLLAGIYRALVGPGAALTVVSGLVLTLQLYGSALSVGGLPHAMMMMQGAGLLGGLIVLLGTVPTASKIARLDPVADAEAFDGLRHRVRVTGMVSGLFGLIALLGGSLLR